MLIRIGRATVLAIALISSSALAGLAVTATSTSATTIGEGTAASPIGRIAWTTLAGDEHDLPGGEIFETPDGFASIEPDPDGRGSRFWVSSDGLHWTLAPLPVPAAGAVGHGEAAGEHWIWSMSDFRLWRSRDLVDWTEVDTEALRPPAIAGIDRRFWTPGPVTAGSTTILPWNVYGSLALADLLAIPLAPGEGLEIRTSREETELGDVRDVYRVQQTVIGPDMETGDRVGSIRIELDGSIVNIFDADRDSPIAQIDAAMAGVPAEELAATLNEYGFIDAPDSGVVISDGAPRALRMPPDVDSLQAVGGRFVALAEDEQGASIVWASTDGLEWEPLGPAIVPADAGYMDPLPHPDGDSAEPLTAVVMIDEADTQREELWSSADGLTWTSLGVTYTYPEPGLSPVHAPGGGYIATGDDSRIHVSPTGSDWTSLDWPVGIGRSIEESGGSRQSSVTDSAVFHSELSLNGGRVLWVVTVDPRDMSPDAKADTVPAADLLPGVSLVTEDVEPGVVRIVHDHHRDYAIDQVPHPEPARRSYDPTSIVAGMDGSVWVFEPDRFYRVGDDGSYPIDETMPDLARQKVEVAPDGTLWTLVEPEDVTPTLRSFKDGTWTVERKRVDDFDLEQDGTVWVNADDRFIRLRDGWKTPQFARDVSDFWMSPVMHGTQVRDDEIEVLVRTGEYCPECDLTVWLLQEDGDTHGGPAGELPAEIVAVDMGEAGDHWVHQRLEVPLAGPGVTDTVAPSEYRDYLVHVTGPSFTVYTNEEGGVPQLDERSDQPIFRAGPNGSIWLAPTDEETGGCGGVARFDGTAWTRYLAGRCVHALDIDTDGDVWLLAGLQANDGPRHVETYVIRPGTAVAAE